MTEPVDKTDLHQSEARIKEHIDLCLQPVIKSIKIHDIMLVGENQRNGLVGDMKEIKATGRVFKWVASIGGGAGLLAGLKSFFNSSS